MGKDSRQVVAQGHIHGPRVAEARADRSIFRRWHETQHPDVILTLYHEVHRWLAEMNLRVPRDTRLIQLERRPDHPG